MSTEEQIHELEVKISYLENTLEELNSKILEQDELISGLQNDIFLLKKRFEDNSEEIRAIEKPPHY